MSNPTTSPDNMRSATAAYVRVGLWGGELEGIYDQQEKFYALRTLADNRIALDAIKFGGSEIKNNIQWISNLSNIMVHTVVEYKGKVTDQSKNNYFMIYLSLDDASSETVAASIQDANENDLEIEILKVAVGYIKYNSDALDKHKEFRKWVLDAKDLAQ